MNTLCWKRQCKFNDKFVSLSEGRIIYKKRNDYLLLNDNNVIVFEFPVDKNRE